MQDKPIINEFTLISVEDEDSLTQLCDSLKYPQDLGDESHESGKLQTLFR